MTIVSELIRSNDGWAEKAQVNSVEANIIRLRDKVDRYDIRLRNGATVRNVQGPAGFDSGDSVTIIMKGRNKPVIIGHGYRNLNEAVEVWV